MIQTCYIIDDVVIFATIPLLQTNTFFYSVNFLKFECL